MKIIFILLLFYSISPQAAIINVPADYNTIQLGINNAFGGDTILVQPGTYPENLTTSGKDILLASMYEITGDTTYISSTVISGSAPLQANSSILTFEGGETNACRVSGFTITAGKGNWRQLGFDFFRYGGGIYCNQSSPVLSNLLITGNESDCGGGILLYRSDARIYNCTITNNSASSTLSQSPSCGGGIAFWNSTGAQCVNSSILNNEAIAGGAFYGLTSEILLSNCLVTYNHATSAGSGVYSDSWLKMKIVNCTITENHCDAGAGLRLNGVMYCLDSTHIEIYNSIFYHNVPAAVINQFNYSENYISISHSDFEGGADSVITNNNGNNVIVSWMNGNINQDPLFVDSTTGNFHLMPTSACINAGDTISLSGSIPDADLDDMNRYNGNIDMGCFEDQSSVSIAGINKTTFTIFPNPVSDLLFLKGTINSHHALIYDQSGRSIDCTTVFSWDGRAIINLSGFESGSYYIRIGGETIPFIICR